MATPQPSRRKSVHRRAPPRLLAFAVTSLGGSAFADPPPRVLVFGGGYGPGGNQISIERQAEALVRATSHLHPKVIFGAPSVASKSVQVLAKPDPVMDVVAQALGYTGPVDVDYVQQSLKASGPLQKDLLLREIQEVARSPSGSIILGVGHGGKGETVRENTIHLWGETHPEIRVSDLDDALEQVNPTAPVAFVLGHCYSGGFVELSFERNRVQQPARCVFAAVPADREASGCTEDVNSPGARSYAHQFASAFTPNPEADFDGDGRITLSEGHAFARIHDPTINVPVASTSVYLARSPRRAAKRSIEKQSISALISRAPKEESAVLSGLLPRIHTLTPGAQLETVGDVVKLHKTLDDDANTIDAQLASLDEDLKALHDTLRDAIFEKYPHLWNPLHAEAARVILNGELRTWAASTDLYQTISDKLEAINELAEQLDKRDHELSTVERFLSSVETVMSLESFKRSASASEKRDFERLRACEAMVVRKIGDAP